MNRRTSDHRCRAGRLLSIVAIALGLTLAPLAGAIAQELPKLRVGILPITSQMPFFAALEKGFFKDAGLDVQMRSFTSAAALLDALNVDAVDIAGVVNVGAMLMAQSQGFDLAVLGGMDGISAELPTYTMVMTRKDSGIGGIKDLAGKRVGIVHLNNNSHVYMKEVLKRHGVDPEAVTWVEVAIPRAPAMLINRQVDATVMIEPFIAVAERSGEVRPLFSEFTEIAPGGLISVQVAKRSWAMANADVRRRYAAALKRGLDYSVANQAEARALLVKYAKLDESLAQKFIWPVWKFEVEAKDIEIGLDLFLKYGVLKQSFPVAPMLLPVTTQ